MVELDEIVVLYQIIDFLLRRRAILVSLNYERQKNHRILIQAFHIALVPLDQLSINHGP